MKKDGSLLYDKEEGLGFAKSNVTPAKPRDKGVTEIRGLYHSVSLSSELSVFEWEIHSPNRVHMP